ncbi:MAG: non-ribosomal peptide synthetase, partial [bacterium]|nr:non-ribosomal peptide synthetase [bacterium]
MKTIDKTAVKDMYPLSPMQEGMLFHHITDPSSPAYFEQISYSVEGEMDHEIFDRAFNRLIERYDILRTVFLHEKVKRPLQVVFRKRSARVHYEDISTLAETQTTAFLSEFRENDKRAGFDLSKDLPIRIAIIKTSPVAYEIVWSYHHIIMDGWCSVILIKEMGHIYRQLKSGGDIRLPAALPYGKYIKWLEKQDKKTGLDYWKTYL